MSKHSYWSELRKSMIFWALAFASSNPSALLYSSLSYFFPNTSDRNLFFEVSDVNVKLYVPSSFKTTGKSLYMEPPLFFITLIISLSSLFKRRLCSFVDE